MSNDILNGAEDLTGRRFSRLLAIEPLRTQKGNLVWLCRCDCGGEARVASGNLKHGFQVSCGCFRRENAARLGRELANQKFGDYRNKREVTYRGKTQSVTKWAIELGLPRGKVYHHLDQGRDLDWIQAYLRQKERR